MSFYSTAIAPNAPWTDRTGRLSLLRLITFLVLLVPAVAILGDLFLGPLRPEPYEHALHETGEWAVRLLLASLAVTPLRRIFRWNRIIGIRRMVGVASLAFGLLHLVLYMAQENWIIAKVVSEIVLRFYLTIGFVGLLGMAVLGATSFDRAVRALGRRWTQLHRLVYPIAVLALWHYFLQTKADVFVPTLMAGLFSLLLVYRLAASRGYGLENVLVLVLCSALAAAATAGVEYVWYALATGFPADRVFLANFNLQGPWRPAVWIGVTGLGVAGLLLLKRLVVSAKTRVRYVAEVGR